MIVCAIMKVNVVVKCQWCNFSVCVWVMIQNSELMYGLKWNKMERQERGEDLCFANGTDKLSGIIKLVESDNLRYHCGWYNQPSKEEPIPPNIRLKD